MKGLIKDALCVPELPFSLTSAKTLRKRGLYTTFTKPGASISKDGSIYSCGKVLGKMYALETCQKRVKTKITSSGISARGTDA